MYTVAELNGHLDLKSKYVYTNGMLVGRIDSSGEFYQYFHDGLGSITMICDSTGTFQNLYTYDDFGDFRHKSENVSNSYCYTGQERDEEPSGLYNLRARYYAAGMGRFTQEDPVFGISGLAALVGCGGNNILIDNLNTTNLYLYAFNNPMKYTDITGLNPCVSLAKCLNKALSVYEKGLKDCAKQREDCMNDPCIDFKRVCILEEKACLREKSRDRSSFEKDCNRFFRVPCIWSIIKNIFPFQYIFPIDAIDNEDTDGFPEGA